MTTFAILAPRTSASAKLLAEKFDIPHFHPRYSRAGVDVLINYGLKGQNERDLYQRNPALLDIPTLNKRPAINKYNAVKLVEEAGVNVPHSVHGFNDIGNNDYIFKPYYSQKGRDIMDAREAYENPDIDTTRGYYQKKITNRIYELRVAAFKWMPKDEWAVWKKVPGEGMNRDQVAWNHDQGGVFQRVENTHLRVFSLARDYAEKVIDKLDMQFGAVDFIVDEDRNVYFIEVNMRPGFTEEYGAEYYYDVFSRLMLNFNYEDIQAMIKNEPIEHIVQEQQEVEEEEALPELIQFGREDEAKQRIKEDLDRMIAAWKLLFKIDECVDSEVIANTFVETAIFAE